MSAHSLREPADARLFLHAAVIAAADGRSADAARWAGKARHLRFTLLPSELGVLRGNALLHPVHEVMCDEEHSEACCSWRLRRDSWCGRRRPGRPVTWTRR